MNPLKRFKSECNGSVAIMFAVATLPILVASGVAIDYSRAVSRRTALQNALDAAVLSASRQTGTSQSDDDFEAFVKKYIEASEFGAVEAVTFERNGTTATATAEAKVPTSVMNVIGIHEMNIKAFTDATWASAEIVLVLDSSNRLSAGTRMAALRSEAQIFINNVMGSDNAVQIGLMPFAVSARVDENTYRGASWLLIPDEGGTPDETVCVEQPNPPPPPPPDDEDGEDGEDGSSSGGTSGGGTTTVCTTTPGTPGNTWNGCVSDRAMTLNLDTNDTYFNNDNAKKYPAILDCRPNEEANLADVVPLTTNRSTLTSGIGSLKAGGGTNITIGVAWGHAMLSSIVPFTASSTGMRKIMILVSGGPSTESGHLPAGTPVTNLNARTRMACTAAKTAGVEIYTVNYQQSPSATQVQLLQDCASGPAYYFDAESTGSSLPKVFATLSRAMRQPRLTH